MLVSENTLLSFKNKQGMSINLAMFTPYFLTECNETLDNDIQTEKKVNLHGEHKTNTNLGPRHIEILGYFDKTSNQREMKKILITTFNAANKQDGILTYTNRLTNRILSIACTLESLPDVRFDNKDNKVHFTINLVAHNPFWQGLGVVANISAIVKLGEFPLVIPPEGFIFGYKSDSLQTVYENVGDVEIGATYRLIANGGDVTNPSIRHVENNQKIKIFYTLKDGEYVDIISMNDYCNVLINGTEQGMIYLLDKTARKFFLIDFGINTIAYEADVNSTFLDVSIIYQDNYLTED